MKKLMLMGVLAAVFLSVVSCAKCVTCEKCSESVEFDGGENDLCEGDFDNSEDYKAAKAVLESPLYGCTCS